MTTRVIETVNDLVTLHSFLGVLDRPFTVEITKGKKRSNEQNHLQRLWINEISAQLGDQTPEEVRGEVKLTLGVPILRAENQKFCDEYDKFIKPLPYETKLAIMMEPLDLPVTRLMTTDQKARYLDAIARHYGAQGIILTQPDGRTS
jgi:hypothetical protein